MDLLLVELDKRMPFPVLLGDTLESATVVAKAKAVHQVGLLRDKS
jgi:hypothetical protein